MCVSGFCFFVELSVSLSVCVFIRESYSSSHVMFVCLFACVDGCVFVCSHISFLAFKVHIVFSCLSLSIFLLPLFLSFFRSGIYGHCDFNSGINHKNQRINIMPSRNKNSIRRVLFINSIIKISTFILCFHVIKSQLVYYSSTYSYQTIHYLNWKLQNVNKDYVNRNNNNTSNDDDFKNSCIKLS